jgi:hypothetical protein
MKDFMSGTSGCGKYLLSTDSGFLRQAFSNEREIVREPSVDAAFERANSGDSCGSQQQRQLVSLLPRADGRLVVPV